MPLVLWSNDLFDREAEPRREGEFDDPAQALAALWRAVLQQGVADDGRPSFTDFHLRFPGRSVRIPRDPSRNPELARLRARRDEPGFLAWLGFVHARHLEQPFDFGPFLAAARDDWPSPVERVVGVLRAALGFDEPLRPAGTNTFEAGPGLRVVGSGCPSSDAVEQWWVSLPALALGGVPVRFEVEVQLAAEGARYRVDADDSPGTQPLRDALLAAGFAG